MNKRLGLFIFFFTWTIFLFAQNIPAIDEAQVRAEMEKRGIDAEDEDIIREKLEKRGFDLDNIDASQVAQLEAALEEVIAELEREKKEVIESATTDLINETVTKKSEEQLEEGIRNVAKESAENVQNAVKQGEALDEVLAEEIVDAQSPGPPAKVYGQQIFRDKSIKVFSKSNDALPPDSYILGPGDKINISIWGISQEDATYEINQTGFIKPSQMPRINLKGISFGKAKQILESRFSQYYRFRPEDFEATITYSRTITVNIYGEVFNPGGFTIPAINTAFNALIAAGGPSDIGSVRNIKLHRDGQPPKRIDVYDFMNDPSVREDFYLQDNDIIHVAVSKRVVSIQGAVKRPFRYELIENEQLIKLIEFAGGLDNNAYQSNIQIKRYDGDEEKLINVNLRDLQNSNADFQLLSGDEVVINAIPKPFKNFVTINGFVTLPGKYELVEGMRISGLLDKVELDQTARMDIAILMRATTDGRVDYEMVNLNEVLQNKNTATDLLLRPQDRLKILSQTSYIDKAIVSITGAVRNPSEHAFGVGQDLKISDAILLAGGLRQDATSFAYIHRQDPSRSKRKEYIRVDLQEAINNPSSTSNLTLAPFDNLVVLSKLTYIDETSITVSGAVRNPGEYQYDESLSLSDVLTMVGGLKLEAASNRIDIFRIVIEEEEPTKTVVATINIDENFTVNGSDIQLEPFDQIVVREVPEFAYQKTVTLKGAVKYPGPYALLDKNEKLSSLINRAGGLTSEAFYGGSTLYRADEGIGYIILDLEDAMKDKNSRFNYILRSGDVVDIPKDKDIVTIKMPNTKSAELYPDKILSSGKFNVAFHEGKSAKYYVDKYAAGIGSNGRRSLITVEHPSGEVERTKRFLGFINSYPKVRKGSIVSVGSKKVKKDKTREDNGKAEIDWGKTIADSLAQATAILSLILLVQQVSK